MFHFQPKEGYPTRHKPPHKDKETKSEKDKPHRRGTKKAGERRAFSFSADVNN